MHKLDNLDVGWAQEHLDDSDAKKGIFFPVI